MASYVLHMYDDYVDVFQDGSPKFVRVQGAPNYATDYQPNDPLHQFLDSLDPPTVSKLFADGDASLNPRNSRAAPAFAACDALFAANP